MRKVSLRICLECYETSSSPLFTSITFQVIQTLREASTDSPRHCHRPLSEYACSHVLPTGSTYSAAWKLLFARRMPRSLTRSAHLRYIPRGPTTTELLAMALSQSPSPPLAKRPRISTSPMAISFIVNSVECKAGESTEALSVGTPALWLTRFADTASDGSSAAGSQTRLMPDGWSESTHTLGTTSASTSATTSVLQCRLCSKRFRERGNVVKHYRSVHAIGPRPFACTAPSCSKAFAFRDGLTRHISTVHQGVRAHSCPQHHCPKMFKQRSHADKHFRTVHTTSEAGRGLSYSSQSAGDENFRSTSCQTI
jgi:Zinc finger, C2H2 type